MSSDASNQGSTVKTIGANGQISLGKEFAGQQVLVEEREPGVWLIRAAVVIPANELWVHQAEAKRDLTEAMEWALANPPKESDPAAVLGMIENAKKSRRKSG